MSVVIAIDQGTTSTRAIVFGPDRRVRGSAQQEFPQHFPASGHVEHDPEDLFRTCVETARAAMAEAQAAANDVAAIGLTNQRETTLVWDRRTGQPLHRAIVWQDRRTADVCARLRADGAEPMVSARTGLVLDPYFSATKIAWILDAVTGARTLAEAGALAFGTVDSYLLWRLTGGKVHLTDATNASRTLLFDIHRGEWDPTLCDLFRVPMAMLPEVRDCAADFGATDPALFGGAIAIGGVAGDQQAATIGQACFSPGMMKSTYGTGCFALLNTGHEAVASRSKLLTTIAYQFAGERTYALEGAIFVAGAAVQWLRDGLKVLGAAREAGPLAVMADPGEDVVMVPAFVGLGAPYWDPDARGAIFGLTRNSGPAEFARAALESVCFQTSDLIAAMRADWPGAAEMELRVDGGMVASDWTMQRLADLLGVAVARPPSGETTALGSAYLAGLRAGVYPSPEVFARTWTAEKRFMPTLDPEIRAARLARWADCVRRTLTSRSA